jgi:hypothetical protein
MILPYHFSSLTGVSDSRGHDVVRRIAFLEPDNKILTLVSSKCIVQHRYVILAMHDDA